MIDKSTINRLASQCVKCALCLPYCPTYELTQDENESPRGRIALFQAFAQDALPLDEEGKKHLDLCLGCRACERVCPAHVEYGHLLTLGRAFLKTIPGASRLKPLSFATRFLSWIVKHPKKQRILQQLLWLLQKSGLRTLASRLHIPKLLGLQKLDSLLPIVPKPVTWQECYLAIGPKRGSVLLFTGCMSAWCDQETVAASIYVLQHLGFEVHLPTNQTCCGAIALHAGDLSDALALAKQNQQAFLNTNTPFDAIITLATGCQAVLSEYELDEGTQFASKMVDIIQFIQSVEWGSHLALKPLAYKIMLHTPCTRRNVLKTPFLPLQLLTRIPELTCQAFQSPHCCGAAGTYMLDHPDFAVPLVKNLLSELDDIQANFIATSNIGCALHIQQQMRESNSAIKVIHPVTLLAKSLGF